MKLKNKKTGEIIILIDHIFDNYKTLAELNAEWEDYEEPKDNNYWYIDYDGYILCGETDKSLTEKKMVDIGNHFNSLEEAEKAVEKLKAFKRLKDKGFRFTGCYMPKSVERLEISASCNGDYVDIMDDLDLLFGGEE